MHTRHLAQVNWLFALVWLAIGTDVLVAHGEALFVRGAVSGEWSAAVDTVVIDSFAWIPQAETLRIAPGRVVAFSGRFSLVVNGTLLANSTGKDTIRVQRRPYHAVDGHLGFRFRNTTTVSKLNLVLFEDGFANVGDAERYGGAIELYQAEVELDSCVFRGNRARIDGGAIYCREAGTLTARDCEFAGDSTRFGGGGAILARTSGSLTLERCRFIENKAITNGGAVVTESGVTPRISDCEFRGNIALQRGGAVQLRSSPVAGYLRDCVIENCKADQGGGLYLDNTRASIEACSIRYCNARLGGAISVRGSNNTSPVSRVMLWGNSAGEDGGGISFIENARCVVSNSVIAMNSALRGGAIHSAFGTAAVMRFVTMEGNTAPEGSAISFNGAGTLTNSVVTGFDSLLYFSQTATPQISFSDIYSSEGSELSGFSPVGLLDETRVNVALVNCDSMRNFSRNPEYVNADLGDFRLTASSPCLFGADTSNARGNDFSANARVAPAGSWPDMGAFESVAPLPLAENCGSASGVWYPGDYIIPCTLRVERQDTLIIMAGSRLLFAPGASLYVEGTFWALGIERDSIIFDRYFELPGSTWDGITLWAFSRESRFDYCAIRRVTGNSAVKIENARAVFSHCTFSANTNSDGPGALNTKLLGFADIQSCNFTGNKGLIGGALCLTEPNSTVRDSRFENNVAIVNEDNAYGQGGAIFANFATISNCVFVRDSAFAGGAIYSVGCDISDCVMDSCRATYGGGLFLPTNLTTVNQTQFRSNSAKVFGGAIGTHGGSIRDFGNTYTGNRAMIGGAISQSRGTYTGDAVIFNNNFADSAGGAIWLDKLVTGTLNACTLIRNHALDGGAVYADSAEIQFEYCLLDSNYATRAGGAVFLQSGGVVMRKSTVVNQRSSAIGSVIHGRRDIDVLANSTLFADNEPRMFAFRTNAGRDFSFCMSDASMSSDGDAIGIPVTVNFNGDSCDLNYNFISEPEFVNSAQRDYHLLSTSRAVHAADSLLPLDADGTRADIGLYSGVRPYQLPRPFNLVSPARNSNFHSGDSITFVWNEARDDDAGDVVSYALRLTGEAIDTTIDTQAERVITISLLNGEYTWWVEAASLRPVGIRESYERRRVVVADPVLDANSSVIPREFGLRLTGPNPFNNNTQLELALPHSADVSIVMHDVLGREALNVRRSYAAGVHIVNVDGASLSSGVYWVTVRAGENLGRVKVLLLK